MTLDENIRKAEEDAKMAESDTEWGMGNYFVDRTEALEYAKNCRQLAEWLKELKAQREAWEKVLDEMMNVSIPGQDAEYVYENIYDIIKKYRPKEGDIE